VQTSITIYIHILLCPLISQVCKKLKERIEHAKIIQYTIELEINGMEMNPNNNWPVADSLKRLSQHQSGWERLEGSNDLEEPIVIPMQAGNIWDLYGGVLAQADPAGHFHFTELPSTFHHIQQEDWKISPDIPSVGDFGMDPGQDLLVWITSPTPAFPMLSLHLRTLKKAEKHPLARHEVIHHDQSIIGSDWHYSIKIMQDYIGLWVLNRAVDELTEDETTSLFIWNWKEGRLELVNAVISYLNQLNPALTDVSLQDILTPDTESFAFISDRHVVLAERYLGLLSDGNEESEIYLMLIDFKAEGATHKPLDEVRNAIKLCYPTRANGAFYDTFELSSDPAPGWEPNDDRAPFFVAKENRVFTLSVHAFRADGEMLAFYHFIPLSTLKKCLGRVNISSRQEMQWSEWAPTSTRLLRTSALPPPVWACCTFGSRFIRTVVSRPAGERGRVGHIVAQVYDFNQLALRGKDSEPRANYKCILQSELLRKQDYIWTEDVETSLPFRCFSGTLPVEASPAHKYLMCTADHIVLADVSVMVLLIFLNIDTPNSEREKELFDI